MRVYYPNARLALTVVFAGNGQGDDSEPLIVPISPDTMSIQRNS